MNKYIFNRQELKAYAKTKISISASFLLVLILFVIPNIITSYGLFSNEEIINIEGEMFFLQTPNLIAVLFVSIIPFVLSYWNSAYFLYVKRCETTPMNSMEFFKTLKAKDFLNYLVKRLVTGIFISLWTLLLIIPGFIKSYSYMLVPLIAVDRPELGVLETIKESKRLMNGYKMDNLVLSLSFIGWTILNSMTAGILGFWLNPYIQITVATFYDKVIHYGENVIDVEVQTEGD